MTIDLTGDELERIFYDDQGAALLMQKVLNEVLQAERASISGRTIMSAPTPRRGYRHVSYRRQLTSRVGRLELEVPRDREEARKAIFEFMEGWYNPHRIHSSLDYQSPMTYEKKHHAQRQEQCLQSVAA